MSKKIVECIPNFSEGRRTETIDSIFSAIASVTGILMLDRTSDPDHNRSVITFAGEPETVVQAAYDGIARAAELIDLDEHTGVHPRIGATDVVPFVPIAGVTMEDCIALARKLGQRVGEELNIPVYLYEKAATRPDRINLADIRRGGYELLKKVIIDNPDRKPDYGPARLSKAGAIAIGARDILIAFNVFLTTDDVNIAQKIARTIRFSSDGLPHVKALGLLIKGRAQVSMNLTNYKITSIHHVLETIRQEAVHYGVEIHSSELIGLMPQDALVATTKRYLQMDDFTIDQVLEQRLLNPLS